MTQETLGSLELNRIYQMDCVEGMRLLPDDSVDLVVTSPPYFNAREYSRWPTYDDFLLFLRRVFVETYRVTKAGRMVAVNFSVIIVPRSKRSEESRRIALPFHFVSLMEEIGFKFLEDIIWIKPEGAAKNRNGGFYQHRQPVAYKPNVINEYILIFQKPMNGLIDRIVRSYSGEIKEKSLVLGEYERSNVWYINPETKVNHPAPFPVELPEKLIRYYSYVRDVVLDPFMGSGTAAVAAARLGRNFIGFERESEYVKIANQRLENVYDGAF